jgi:hypothetical protein
VCFSEDLDWLAKIMQHINVFYLRYTRCTHIEPSRCTLTLCASTRHTHVAYVAQVHSSYALCTHVMLCTLHSRNVAQVHSCCTRAFIFMLHRCTHVAQCIHIQIGTFQSNFARRSDKYRLHRGPNRLQTKMQ